MKKTSLITIITTFTLGFSSLLTVSSVNAESIQNIQSNIVSAQQQLSSLQVQRSEVEVQIQKNEQAIADNSAKIQSTNAQITEAQTEIEQLNSAIDEIEERIAVRNETLKARAVSYQASGGQLSYLDVVFGSKNFGDFIDRVGAVTKILDADREMIEAHEEDKKAVEEKYKAVEQKLNDLNSMKIELEGMQAQIAEQKANNEALRAQLVNQENDSKAEISSLQEQKAELQRAAEAAITAVSVSPKSQTGTSKGTSVSNSNSIPVSNTAVSSGSISTVINAGNKYIGNSVYVFGGGRTASDIANGRFDCSGFVSWAFSQAGVRVGASTDTLKNTGTPVSVNEMRPGDMVFFNTYKQDGHVGIYIGGGKFIGSQSSTGVAIANMSSGYWANTFNGRVMRVIH
ncbi:cell wall-associated hydrolase, invasion-associated protein [Mycobacteroides abscessus subsp. abscessus]|nr:cell wall-associated hydrolase, invasion-associated protein [Mycobacteroides abscessus subsp. abscessus]